MKYKNSQVKEIPLSQTDRLTYLFKYHKRQREVEIIEVINVSYEILVNKKWITIVRYDSSHGFLHRHVRLSFDNPTDTPIPIAFDGTHADWLTWAIDDILTNFESYKKEFLEQSDL